MTTTQKLGLAAVALIAFNFVSKAVSLSRINILPGQVSDFRFSGTTPVATITMIVQNAGNQSAVMRSIVGNVYANGYLIGNVSSFQPQTIAANSQSTVAVNLRFGIFGIVNNLVEVFQTKQYSQDIEFDAVAVVDGIQIPINFKYKVGA